jgi:predicted aspartyl protease
MESPPQRPEVDGVPFTIHESKPLLIVEAWINGKGPYNFAVDTGASMTVVAPSAARRAAVRRLEGRGKALSATGTAEVTLGKLDALRIGATEAADLDVTIMSLAPLNRALRLRLAGLVGYNLLKRFRVTIDYPNRRLLLES